MSGFFRVTANLCKEVKTGIRSWMIRFGITTENSSTEKQKQLELNKDSTLRPDKSEGEKLRQ